MSNERVDDERLDLGKDRKDNPWDRLDEYDKEMYNKQESLRTIIVLIIVFLLGFFAGYIAHSFNETHEPENTNSTYIVEDK